MENYLGRDIIQSYTGMVNGWCVGIEADGKREESFN